MRRAIEAAYRTQGPIVLRRARSLLGNDADAREVVQEVFTSLLARPEQYSGAGSLMAFLYRATTNRCLNRIRNRKTRARLLRNQGPPLAVAPARAETCSVVRELLERLPEQQAAVAVYYYIDGMTQVEIAGMLGCSRRHVGNLLTRLRGRVSRDEVTP